MVFPPSLTLCCCSWVSWPVQAQPVQWAPLGWGLSHPAPRSRVRSAPMGAAPHPAPPGVPLAPLPPLSGVTRGSHVRARSALWRWRDAFFLRERMTKGGNKIQRKTGRRMQYQRQRARNPEAEQPKLLFPQQLAFTLLTPPGRRSPCCHRTRARVHHGGWKFVISSFTF